MVSLTAPEHYASIEIVIHTQNGHGTAPLPLDAPVWLDDISLTSSYSGGDPIPEPGTLLLLGVPALALAVWRRKRRET